MPESWMVCPGQWSRTECDLCHLRRLEHARQKYVGSVSQPVSPYAANRSGMGWCHDAGQRLHWYQSLHDHKLAIPSIQRLKLKYHLGNRSEAEEHIYQCRLQPQAGVHVCGGIKARCWEWLRCIISRWLCCVVSSTLADIWHSAILSGPIPQIHTYTPEEDWRISRVWQVSNFK